METKFTDYPNAIPLDTHQYVNILDKKTDRVWTVSWLHAQHDLHQTEINNPPLIPHAKETAIEVDADRFVILNPSEEGHEILIQLSFDNIDRNLELKLLKRPYHEALDFMINSKIVYYGECSPFYGITGIVENENGTEEFDGTLMDKYPVFINYSASIS